MSVRGSRSPDISAIEERILAQSERAARIRAEAAAEAQERETRVREAMMQGTVKPDPAPHKSDWSRIMKHQTREAIRDRLERKRESREAAHNGIVLRDPCMACGVRRDLHDALGCKRWRGER
jgi:protein required for attachment to host cells